MAVEAVTIPIDYQDVSGNAVDQFGSPVVLPANCLVTDVEILRTTAWDALTEFTCGIAADPDLLVTNLQHNLTGAAPDVETVSVSRYFSSATAVTVTWNQGAATQGVGSVTIQYITNVLGASGGTPSSVSPVDPLPYTLLSLPRYADILGINPVHFQRGTAQTIFPVDNKCTDLWPRYSWQYSDHISHEDLARAIYDAEQDIARELGWYPAPWFISEEIQQYPRHHRPDVFRRSGRNVRGMRLSVITDFAKVIAGGQRAVELIGQATTAAGSLAYTDEDGDGFAETATIVLSTSYTSTQVKSIKAYFYVGGDQRWEIRPARAKAIAGGNVVMTFWSWLLIDPETQGQFPTSDGFGAIDLSTTANFVDNVYVYLEYVDDTDTSAEFYWEPYPGGIAISGICSCCSGDGCPACEYSTQTGCLHVRDAERGIVVPQAATYDASNTQWSSDAFSVCRDPEFVKIWYLAGEYEDRYLNGALLDPLSDYWAHAIAWLATTKLERPFCSCGNVVAHAQHLKDDLAFTGTDTAYQVDPSALSNPFGTRRGAIMAWQRVSKFALHRRQRPALA